jgi:hypothetical protein
MDFTIPLLLNSDRQVVGIFSVNTSDGALVFVFRNMAKWDAFASPVTTVLNTQGSYLGSTSIPAGSIEELADQLVADDPTLAAATFVPDSAPILGDVIEFFEQQS